MQINDVIKSKINFIEEIQKIIDIKKKGNYYWANCIFHNEKTASMCINSTKEIFHCFGCGEHGDIFTLLMKKYNKSFKDIIEDFCRKLGIKYNDKKSSNQYKTYLEVLEIAKDIYVENIKNNVDALRYLEYRGVTKESIEFFQIGFCSNNAVVETLLKKGYKIDVLDHLGVCKQNIGKDRFLNRIIFPIFSQKKQVIGFSSRTMVKDQVPKYINSPDSKIFSKSLNLYNQENITHDSLFLVEGYLDVIAMHQSGYSAVAAMSTTITREQFQLITKKSKKIYFMFDGDEAGKNAIIKNIHNIMPYLEIEHKVFICNLPNGLDPMDLYKKKEINNIINNAVEMHLWLLDFFYVSPNTHPHLEAEIYKQKENLCKQIENKYLKYAYTKILLFKKNNYNQSYKNIKNNTDNIDPELQLICWFVLYPDIIDNFLELLVKIKFKKKYIQEIVDFIVLNSNKNNDNNQTISEYIKERYKEITESLKIFNIFSIIVDRSFILRHLENICVNMISPNEKKVVYAARRILNAWTKQNK